MKGARSRSPSTVAKSPKVRKDPLKEYDEAIGGNGVELVGLLDPGNVANVKTWISTGSLALDQLLNKRGIPCGRITEIYGPQHIGKSTVLDQIIAGVQRMGGFGVLIDTEAARDNVYVRALGVDSERLRMLQFKSWQDVTIENIVDKVIQTLQWWIAEFPEAPVVIGWDSLGNVTTNDEIVKPVGDRTVASAAKAMRDAMRKLTQLLARSNTALIIINHQYSTIPQGGMRVAPRETYGGQALRLAATYRLELFNKGLIKRTDGAVVGKNVGARLDKNRFGFCRDQDIAVLTGLGVSNSYTLFETLKDAGHIQQAGSWATLSINGEEHKMQGWTGLERKFSEVPTLFGQCVELYQQVMNAAV